jgi:hypothetical protein
MPLLYFDDYEYYSIMKLLREGQNGDYTPNDLQRLQGIYFKNEALYGDGILTSEELEDY